MRDQKKILEEVRAITEQPAGSVSIKILRDRRDAIALRLKSLGSTFSDLFSWGEDSYADMRAYEPKKYTRLIVKFEKGFAKIEEKLKDLEDAIKEAEQIR